MKIGTFTTYSRIYTFHIFELITQKYETKSAVQFKTRQIVGNSKFFFRDYYLFLPLVDGQ